MMMLGPGSWMLFPAALRFACQRFFMARPPRAIASEDPVVAVPVAFSFFESACHSSASIDTQREWRRVVAGYSSESIKFLAMFSIMILVPYSSIEVCTNEARLRVGFPSRESSVVTSSYASRGGIPFEGNAYFG